MAAKPSATEQRLRQLYYDGSSSGAFGGIDRLYRSATEAKLKVTREQVAEFLSRQQAYSLHKPSLHHYARNRTYTSRIDHQWQIDLADMQSLASENNGNKYLLTCIDVFSKFAWVVPVKDKTGKVIVAALEHIFKSSKRRPERIQSDKGTEFFNKHVQDLFKRNNIHHFASNSDQKAAVVERFNRTIKNRIWTYFTANATKRYVDVLQKLVDGYNNSFHRMIGMKPVQVTEENSNQVWLRLYHQGKLPSSKSLPKKKPLKPGQMVRINRWKGNFEKGYMPNWSREHFLVTETQPHPRRVYKLEDMGGEPVQGQWYTQELQPVTENKFEVEKVLKKRYNKAEKVSEALVKWKGWPDKFNSWIKQSEVGDREKHKYTQ